MFIDLEGHHSGDSSFVNVCFVLDMYKYKCLNK